MSNEKAQTKTRTEFISDVFWVFRGNLEKEN